MLTPLVDVVFILLVFFMLVSSFSSRGIIGIMTPAEAERASDVGAPKTVLIRVSADGALNFSGVPMSPSELGREITRRSAQDPTLSYLVQPSAKVSVQQVVSAVDLLKSFGATNVSLTRRPPRR